MTAQDIKTLLINVFLSAGLLVVFFVSQIVGIVLFAPYFLPNAENLSTDAQLQLASQHGMVISFTAILSFFMVFFTILILAKLQKMPLKTILPIKKSKLSLWIIFSIILVFLNTVFYQISLLLEREPMLFMDSLAQTANPLWVLILAVVLIIPIYEELIFRGFMWSALVNSKLGIVGACLITSGVFAWVHFQYGVVELMMIFALALLFGMARLYSGSLKLPIFLHITNNSMAMWQFL